MWTQKFCLDLIHTLYVNSAPSHIYNQHTHTHTHTQHTHMDTNTYIHRTHQFGQPFFGSMSTNIKNICTWITLHGIFWYWRLARKQRYDCAVHTCARAHTHTHVWGYTQCTLQMQLQLKYRIKELMSTTFQPNVNNYNAYYKPFFSFFFFSSWISCSLRERYSSCLGCGIFLIASGDFNRLCSFFGGFTSFSYMHVRIHSCTNIYLHDFLNNMLQWTSWHVCILSILCMWSEFLYTCSLYNGRMNTNTLLHCTAAYQKCTWFQSPVALTHTILLINKS